MTSMCVLGLRPVTLLNDEALQTWGNDSIRVLADHFGTERNHTYTDVDTGDANTVRSPPLVDSTATVSEWREVKQVVKMQGYPRNSTSEVWGIIKQYHGDQFPNLLKLAELALTHPVHTSDCERAFSAQNHVTTPLRNRISSDHCSQLMKIMIEGPEISKFNFMSALEAWRDPKLGKNRLIFKRK